MTLKTLRIALLAATIAVAGCSSSDDGSDAAANDDTTSTSATRPPETTAPVDEVEEEAEEEGETQGTPQEPSPGTHSAGAVTITATLCTIDGTTFTGTSSSRVLPTLAWAGGQVYLANEEGQVLRFDASTDEGCRLTLDETWGDGGSYTPEEAQSAVEVAGDRVFMSGGVFETEVVSASTGASYTCAVSGTVVPRPDAATGIAFFPGSAIKHVDFTDTNCTVTEPSPLAASLPFQNQNAAAAHFLADGVLVAGGELPEGHKVIAFGPDGAELWRHGSDGNDDQRYGWVHGIAPCAGGICTVDTNYKRLQVLRGDGGWVTSANLNDLLGLPGSAWWQDIDVDDQGRLWMPVGAGRTDGDGADGFVFLVTVEGL